MDELKIHVEERDNCGYIFYVGVITINNIKLIDVLKREELTSANDDGQPNLAGAYDSMEIRMLYSHLRNPNKFFYPGNKVSVLVCECGEEGCWPFAVKITDKVDYVEWSEFTQPHRPHWKYLGMHSYKFSSVEYKKILVAMGREIKKANSGLRS
jgi:hypothetical protein